MEHEGAKIYVLQSRPQQELGSFWTWPCGIEVLLFPMCCCGIFLFLMNHQGARSNNVLPSCCCTWCSHYYLCKHCANLVQLISALLKYQWSCRPAETWAFSCQSQGTKKGKIYWVSFSSLGPFTYLSLPPQETSSKLLRTSRITMLWHFNNRWVTKEDCGLLIRMCIFVQNQ